MTTMRAVLQDRYGSPDVLHLGELPVPTPGAGEVLVRVGAAGVDMGTVHLVHGTPLLLRLGFGLRRPKVPVPGRDVAGTVEVVGEGVTGFAPGDRVFGTADGSFAEHAVVPVRRLAHRPPSLTVEEAAALPVSGLTAYQAVRGSGVGPGQRVLVLGASGGVGTYAVQLAVAAGATVTATSGPAKRALVEGLGAHRVLDHTSEPLDAEGVRYDVVLAIGGDPSLRSLRRVTAPRGTIVLVGRDAPGRVAAGYHRTAGSALLGLVLRQRVVMHVAKELGTDLAELGALVEQGAVRPVVERGYPLAEAAAAVTHVGAGRARGKVVVSVDPTA